MSLRTAAPGGGSASAAAAALGISLLMMTANFSVNKTGSKKKNEEIKQILSALAKAQKRMMILIDRDIELYGSVRQVLSLPKSNVNEINYRNKKLQSALKKSISAPAEVCEISSDVIPVAERLIEIGNNNLISDSYCGVSLLRAAIETAEFNMNANIRYISDSGYRTSFSGKYGKLIGTSFARIKKIFKKYESENN